jgi:hypothetical protein
MPIGFITKVAQGDFLKIEFFPKLSSLYIQGIL